MIYCMVFLTKEEDSDSIESNFKIYDYNYFFYQSSWEL